MTPLKDFHDPAPVADFLAKMGVDAATGLSRDDAMTRRTMYGANRVTPPVNCPSWVCCLLPCLLRTPSMVAYHAALPREAMVKRLQGNGKTRKLRMDAASLVYGDIVEVKAGEIVSADLRIIECSDDCIVDQSILVGPGQPEKEDDLSVAEAGGHRTPPRQKKVTVAVTDKKDPLVSGNVVLMATQILEGCAVGVVIATGDETVWGQLVQIHEWPVTKGAGSKRLLAFTDDGEDEQATLMGK